MLGSKHRVKMPLWDILKHSKQIHFALGYSGIFLVNIRCEIVKINISWTAVNTSSESENSTEILEFQEPSFMKKKKKNHRLLSPRSNSPNFPLLSLFCSTWPFSALTFLSLASWFSAISFNRFSFSCSAACCCCRWSCCFRNFRRCSCSQDNFFFFQWTYVKVLTEKNTTAAQISFSPVSWLPRVSSEAWENRASTYKFWPNIILYSTRACGNRGGIHV